MWYLWKMWIWKWEFCEKCILKMWISWMMWFWTCGFLDQIWIFAPVCFPMNYIVYGFKIGNNLWLWEINLKASKVTKPKLVTMETEKNVFMILHMFCWCCDVMTLFLLSFWKTEDLHCKFSFYDVGQKDNNNSWWCRKSREKMLSFPFICIFPRRINGL